MRPRRLLDRLRRGEFQNVRFDDACSLAEALGFRLRRVSGSHHIYIHGEIKEPINLQDVKGEAKPYQLRQLLELVRRYALELEDRL